MQEQTAGLQPHCWSVAAPRLVEEEDSPAVEQGSPAEEQGSLVGEQGSPAGVGGNPPEEEGRLEEWRDPYPECLVSRSVGELAGLHKDKINRTTQVGTVN